jgi:hypothetical protein
MPHQGEILQEAIKNSGISITRIVEELGITRPTIYRKFKDDTLDANFVNNRTRLFARLYKCSAIYVAICNICCPFRCYTSCYKECNTRYKR